ncbi:MAG: peptide deformylase [Bacteroidales bacterium]|nr:peptide deformylase [Bacteroidales bacterium]
MIYPIHIIGSSVLRKKAVEIDENYPGLKEFIENMHETMHSSEGVGLAAPQAGKAIRLFVIDAEPMAEDIPELKDFKRTFINPQIIEKSTKKTRSEEGCLSIPEVREDVERHTSLTIEYYNENFEKITEKLEGMAAVIIQHEYDHLDGILFTDKVSALRKKFLKRRLANIAKGNFNKRYKFILGEKFR